MPIKFIYCFDEDLAGEYKAQGLLFMYETSVDGKKAYLFSCNNKMKFAQEDETKIIKTNRLLF